jgi:hypothetical protein
VLGAHVAFIKEKRMMEGVNSSMIYCKNFCKCPITLFLKNFKKIDDNSFLFLPHATENTKENIRK